jgi:galactonate dehydratase
MRIETVDGLLAGSAVEGVSFLVRLTTDDGLIGLGQSAAWGYPEACASVVETFKRYLIGTDPLRIEHHWHLLYRALPFRGSILSGALSAVDIALWDIKGQHFQTPVWELLGGRCRDRIRLQGAIAGRGPEELARQARAAVADGFTALKFDPLVAGYQDLAVARLVAAVRERVAAVRQAVGLDVDLMIELHRKLTPLTALALVEALREFSIVFVEDPIQIDSIQSQADFARRVNLPVAHGERLNTIWEFRELLVAGGPQYVRPDVGLAGGLTHCKKIAALAEAFHCAVVTHNYLSPLLTAASVHLDTCIPNFIVQEYATTDESNPLFRSVLRREGGYLSVPEVPGLGVTLDAAALATSVVQPLDPSTTPLRADGSVALAV